MGTNEVVLLCNPSCQGGFLFDADRRGGVLSPERVDVRELIAWGLDEFPYRGGARQEGLAKYVERAQQRLAERECYANYPALLEEETKGINHLLSECKLRPDLQV